MNPREKAVALGVGLLISALVGWYGVSTILAGFEEKYRRLDKATSDLKTKKADMLKAQAAAKRRADYEERSLPPDVEKASSLYQTWLIGLMDETGLTDSKLSAPTPSAVVKLTYRRLGFTVTARGDLSQVVSFLYRFQEMDWLHRIDSMKLVPMNDSKKIDISFTISALALSSAPKSEKLAPRLNEKWVATTLAEYRDPILNRNFFGAPNLAPKLDVPSRSNATLGKTFELPIKATDPDPLDRVKFVLKENVDPPAKLDPESGKLTWTPKAKGDYTFTIDVVDDGLPAKSTSKTIQVTVNDPPPKVEKPPEPPKKLAFDDAKYTVLTAVIGVDDAAEIWLHIRPRNEIRHLQAGDQFEIGSVKGEVSEIGIDEALLTVNGRLRKIGRGETLLDAADTTD